MKKCPVCPRTYPDDLTYCLEDGNVLRPAYENEATLIYPHPPDVTSPPTPSPSPSPTPISPPKKSKVGVIVSGLAFLLLFVVIGGIKMWIRVLGDQQRTASANYNSSPSTLTSLPTITPEVSPSPSPSPSPIPEEAAITAGTYECEITRSFKNANGETPATVRLRVNFDTDGTYLQQAYITVHGTEIRDQLGVEEKGSYAQHDTEIWFTNRLQRELNLSQNEWGSWTAPSDGNEMHEKIRNVTSNTFQLYDGDEHAWFTFSKQ